MNLILKLKSNAIFLCAKTMLIYVKIAIFFNLKIRVLLFCQELPLFREKGRKKKEVGIRVLDLLIIVTWHFEERSRSGNTMWVEIFCGLIVYRLFRGFFSDDNVLDVETSDSRALFSVANRYLLKI